ncbi:MAG: methyltransferase domain-containing protein, partial [Caldilineaceae bacterium]
MTRFGEASGAGAPAGSAAHTLNPSAPAVPPVIDYEGSLYRTDFWAGQGRDYEDAAERLAIARLLPSAGRRVAEIGAGFGRLAELYLGYEQVILVDYSRTLLYDAVERWGDDARFVFVAGNVYALPLATGTLDSLVMVRVMHHLADVQAGLNQLARTLHRDSIAVIEFANKRNLKALARWAARRQSWSPLDPQPVEFVPLNFDFHPDWMADRFAQAGLAVKQRLGVSHFRTGALKRRMSPNLLAQADSALFGVGGRFPLAPSVFLQATLKSEGATGTRNPAGTLPDAVAALFRCPACGTDGLERSAADLVTCPSCKASYARVQG